PPPVAPEAVPSPAVPGSVGARGCRRHPRAEAHRAAFMSGTPADARWLRERSWDALPAGRDQRGIGSTTGARPPPAFAPAPARRPALRAGPPRRSVITPSAVGASATAATAVGA